MADFPQGPRRPKLTKQHGHELSPTGKTARMALGLVLRNGLLEFLSRQQLQDLGKNGAYSIQGGSLLRLKFGSGEPDFQSTGASAESRKLIWTPVVGNLRTDWQSVQRNSRVITI